VILVSLDATAVFMRTKALRALGQIVTADPGILRNVSTSVHPVFPPLTQGSFFFQVNVQKAIETHLLDSSPQVRDAAVELIGKYVVSLPEVAGDYYDQISERIAVGC
jgi:cohesin loading factor subunit SCC2